MSAALQQQLILMNVNKGEQVERTIGPPAKPFPIAPDEARIKSLQMQLEGKLAAVRLLEDEAWRTEVKRLMYRDEARALSAELSKLQTETLKFDINHETRPENLLL